MNVIVISVYMKKNQVDQLMLFIWRKTKVCVQRWTVTAFYYYRNFKQLNEHLFIAMASVNSSPDAQSTPHSIRPDEYHDQELILSGRQSDVANFLLLTYWLMSL